MSRRRRGPRGLAAAGILAALLIGLSGCARIPTSGPVGQGQEIAEDGDQTVRYLPRGPIGGETPVEIVQYFLRAGIGTQPDYDSARQFLTAEFVAEWEPSQRVLVYSGVPEYLENADGSITVRIEAVAEIGSDGQYVRLDSPKRMELDYFLAQTEGEWRIRQGPDGLVLHEQQFSDTFKAYTLWFFDQSHRYMVPDVRWFADNVRTPSRIVQASLAGPAPWLAQAGTTGAFPPGTTLQGTVRIEDGVATADFSQSISTAVTSQFSLMRLQLERSLRDVPTIQEVSMTVNEAAIDIGLPPEDLVTVEPQVNSTPLVYRDGQIGYITGNALTAPTGTEELNDMIAGIAPVQGTLSVEQRMSAFLTPEGVVAVPFDRPEIERIDRREGLIAPALDPYGYVWTASDRGPELRVEGTDRGGHRQEFAPGSLGAEGVLSMQLSREGSRVAMLVRDRGTVRLAIMSVIRDVATGMPTGLGSPIVMGLGSGQPVDLTWVDESQTYVAVLVDDGAGSSSVRVQHVGGELVENGAVPNGAQITGGNSAAGLRVLDRSGNLFVPRSARWDATGARVSFLITQVV